jgi:hypothetical protein
MLEQLIKVLHSQFDLISFNICTSEHTHTPPALSQVNYHSLLYTPCIRLDLVNLKQDVPFLLTCKTLQSIHEKGIEVAASNQKPVTEVV